MYLQTRRLLIRDYREEDWSDMLEVFGDLEVMKFCEPAYDEAQVRQTLPGFKGIAYAATLDGKAIGHLLFKQLPLEEEGIYEIGWIFGKACWRQGYAFEAAKALIDYGFRELHLHKICAETEDPVKSGGLAQKLGMDLEARFRAHTRDIDGNWADLYWYAIVNPNECK